MQTFLKKDQIEKTNWPVIRQKDESRNGCFKKTKHAKSFKKRTFLTPDTHTYDTHSIWYFLRNVCKCLITKNVYKTKMIKFNSLLPKEGLFSLVISGKSLLWNDYFPPSTGPKWDPRKCAWIVPLLFCKSIK